MAAGTRQIMRDGSAVRGHYRAEKAAGRAIAASRVRIAMRGYRNVFEEIVHEGHEENFVPVETDGFQPADLPAGSREKIELLRQRVELGVPMWHEADRSDYDGLVGAIRPRS